MKSSTAGVNTAMVRSHEAWRWLHRTTAPGMAPNATAAPPRSPRRRPCATMPPMTASPERFRADEELPMAQQRLAISIIYCVP